MDQKTRQIKVLGYDRAVVGQTAAEIGVFARLSHIMARAFVTWVRRSVAKPVRLGKEPSKPWPRILDLSHAYAVMRGGKNLAGTAERPCLNVFKSLSGIYAQVIDDQSGRTLLSASTVDHELREKVKG